MSKDPDLESNSSMSPCDMGDVNDNSIRVSHSLHDLNKSKNDTI